MTKQQTNQEMLRLAAEIAQHLKCSDIDVVLVGGLAVSCYTENQYLTKDIDMVDITGAKPATIHRVMERLGFYKNGRVYVSDDTEVIVEFPSSPLAVGDELITEYDHYTSEFGDIPILKAEDVIKDRLAAYFHWNDLQSLFQALSIMLHHRISPETVNEFCLNESTPEELEQISRSYYALTKERVLEISEIEKFIMAERIRRL